MFRKGGGLGTDESYVPVVFFVPLLHWSPCFFDVDFATLAGNPVNYAILISWVALSVTEVSMIIKFLVVMALWNKMTVFLGAQTDVAVGFVAFDGIQTI